MFLEILIVLFVQLSLVVGRPAAILILIVVAIIAVCICHFIASWFAEAIVGGGPSSSFSMPRFSRSSREGPLSYRSKTSYTRMSDGELSKQIEKSPRNPAAVLEHCRRLKESGDLMAYARRMEFFLSLDTTMEIEEVAMMYHQLADLYLGPLKAPHRALQALEQFVAKHPGTTQAQFAKERIYHLNAAAQETG